MKKKTNYRNKIWFSLDMLADFIAEFNHDGGRIGIDNPKDKKFNHTAWEFWRWLDKKCK